MTDSDAPRGVARSTRPGTYEGGSTLPPTEPLTRTASAPVPLTDFGPPAAASGEDSAGHYTLLYSRTGSTPIPYLVAAFAAMGAAWWAYGWSEVTPEAVDPVRTSEWWTNITSVLLPGEDLRLASYSPVRMGITLALMVLAALVIAMWIGRVGTNVRTEHAPFGAFLPLVAFPAWWLLPISIGLTDGTSRSRSDLLVRFLVAFAILFAQFLLLRWPTLNRMWRAGHLPYDLASILLWLPMMIPWSMFMLSTAFTALASEAGEPGDSAWQPTSAMVDWARGLTRATGAAILVLLVVVSVAQHLGLQKDRAADRVRRQASAGDPFPT